MPCDPANFMRATAQLISNSGKANIQLQLLSGWVSGRAFITTSGTAQTHDTDCCIEKQAKLWFSYELMLRDGMFPLISCFRFLSVAQLSCRVQAMFNDLYGKEYVG